MLIGLVDFGFSYRMLHPTGPKDADSDAAASLTPLWLECLLPAVLIGGACWAVFYFWRNVVGNLLLVVANIGGPELQPPVIRSPWRFSRPACRS